MFICRMLLNLILTIFIVVLLFNNGKSNELDTCGDGYLLYCLIYYRVTFWIWLIIVIEEYEKKITFNFRILTRNWYYYISNSNLYSSQDIYTGLCEYIELPWRVMLITRSTQVTILNTVDWTHAVANTFFTSLFFHNKVSPNSPMIRRIRISTFPLLSSLLSSIRTSG